MTRAPLALPLPLPPPPVLTGEALKRGMAHSLHALRQRWDCLGPDCPHANGLRSWCKLPSRIQLQQGWCCSPDCFQQAFEMLAAPLLHGMAQPHHPRQHRVPLGLVLLSRGEITHEQLLGALDQQRERGHGRIGDWLMRAGAVGEEDVADAVALQWARPTFPLAQSLSWQLCRGWVPLAIQEKLRMLLVHFAAPRRRLYVAFTQQVDFRALAGLAEVFECKVESCIVTDSAMQAVFEQMHQMPGHDQLQDISFDHMGDAREVAAAVRQYARYAEARQIRLAAFGPYLWVRIKGDRMMHLTFRCREQ
ncbi:MAG: hypothetical protein ACRD01_13645 [Terriglobales bacterium]